MANYLAWQSKVIRKPNISEMWMDHEAHIWEKYRNVLGK